MDQLPFSSSGKSIHTHPNHLLPTRQLVCSMVDLNIVSIRCTGLIVQSLTFAQSRQSRHQVQGHVRFLALSLLFPKLSDTVCCNLPQALVGSDADLSHVWAGSLQPRLYDTMPAIATCSSTKPIESHGKSTVICQVEAVHQAHSPDFIA